MGLFKGPDAGFKAIGMLFSGQGLLPLAIIPAVVGLAVSILGIWLAGHYGDQLVTWIWPEPDSWFPHIFWWIFSSIIGLASGLLALIITPWLVMLVGFPLCDPLMKKAYTLLGGEAVKASFAAEMRRMVASMLGITLIGLVGAICLFALGIIPGLALITVPFATLVWTPMFLSFDSMDPTLGRKQLEFKQKVGVLKANFWTCVGLGLTGTLLVSVPFLNLLGLPILAVAGVIVVRDLELAGKLPEAQLPELKAAEESGPGA